MITMENNQSPKLGAKPLEREVVVGVVVGEGDGVAGAGEFMVGMMVGAIAVIATAWFIVTSNRNIWERLALPLTALISKNPGD